MKTQTKTLTRASERKILQRAALRSRLDAALRDIYANARTPWPRADVPGFATFSDWLGDYAEREVDAMTIENFGMTTRETARAGLSSWSPAWCRLVAAQQETPAYASERATTRAKINHAFPCGPYEAARAVLILDAQRLLVGTRKDGRGNMREEARVYSAGRMGKTFYPDAFASDNHGFAPRDMDGLSAETMTRTVQFIEQFNVHVRSVAADAPGCYEAEARDALAEQRDMTRDTIRKTRGQYAALAAELRTLRDVHAPTACDVLRGRLAQLARRVHQEARGLAAFNSTLANLDTLA